MDADCRKLAAADAACCSGRSGADQPTRKVTRQLPLIRCVLALVMAQSPDIGSDICQIGLRKWRAADRRHRARVLLGLRHAIGDRMRDGAQAAVPPKPFAARQVGAHSRALAVHAVAAGASAIGGRPWKICSPRASCAGVTPGGGWRSARSLPAFGWITFRRQDIARGSLRLHDRGGADAIATSGLPTKVICQMRPPMSSPT